MTLTLGVDVGTFEAKGALVDGEGRVVASAARGHRMRTPRPGWAEHDMEADWWAGFRAVVAELLTKRDAGEIAAVGVSGIGPCMAPVDAGGRPLTNAVLYGVDVRAEAEIAELTETLGAEAVLERCGAVLTSQSVGPKILWLRRNRPEIWAETAKVLNSSSFLVHRLTGRFCVDHYTGCGYTPLYDRHAQDWDDGMAEAVCGRDRLPDLLWSSEVAGEVTRAAAEATGLTAGTPVVAGTIDAAAEALGAGVRAPGEMMVMYGSTHFVILRTEAPVVDARLWHAPWLFPGEYASMAGAATSGTLTHWFRDNFAAELDASEAWARLAAEAEASPPGAKGLIALPYFSGERTPIHDPRARGVIFGLDLTHGRGDVYRALLEGIAFGLAHIAETFAEAGQTPERLIAVGGGVKNRVWAQAVSDALDRPQSLPREGLGAAYGDAFLAAVGIGAARPDDIRDWNPAGRTIEPQPEAARLYAGRLPLFKRLYGQTRDLIAELS